MTVGGQSNKVRSVRSAPYRPNGCIPERMEDKYHIILANGTQLAPRHDPEEDSNPYHLVLSSEKLEIQSVT